MRYEKMTTRGTSMETSFMVIPFVTIPRAFSIGSDLFLPVSVFVYLTCVGGGGGGGGGFFAVFFFFFFFLFFSFCLVSRRFWLGVKSQRGGVAFPPPTLVVTFAPLIGGHSPPYI